MSDEIAAIDAYRQKHSTCDIQKHPWQAVFGAGFEAGRDHAAAEREAREAECARLRTALRAAWRFWAAVTGGHPVPEGVGFISVNVPRKQFLAFDAIFRPDAALRA